MAPDARSSSCMRMSRRPSNARSQLQVVVGKPWRCGQVHTPTPTHTHTHTHTLTALPFRARPMRVSVPIPAPMTPAAKGEPPQLERASPADAEATFGRSGEVCGNGRCDCLRCFDTSHVLPATHWATARRQLAHSALGNSYSVVVRPFFSASVRHTPVHSTAAPSGSSCWPARSVLHTTQFATSL